MYMFTVNIYFYVHIFVMIFCYVHTCKDHRSLLLGEHHHSQGHG